MMGGKGEFEECGDLVTREQRVYVLQELSLTLGKAK